MARAIRTCAFCGVVAPPYLSDENQARWLRAHVCTFPHETIDLPEVKEKQERMDLGEAGRPKRIYH